jgi:pimeloyl-ACP methyl ester carboxylesterase
MTVLTDLARPGQMAPVRIIMLPPAFGAAEDFRRAGFVSAARARGLALDLVFAGLKTDTQRVTDGSLAEQVRQLLAPARAQGVQVWLGGISLGGYIALCCAEREPAALAGLCLLAPYLGTHLITAEVARAGIEAWDPTERADEDDERRIWRFIKQGRPPGFPIHLGLGREDRFAERHRVLAAALGSADVDTVPGGHDWPTWHRLWENFLDARFSTHD